MHGGICRSSNAQDQHFWLATLSEWSRGLDQVWGMAKSEVGGGWGSKTSKQAP